MRNGRKVYDSDTHLRPTAEMWDDYLPAAAREVLQARYQVPLSLIHI